MNGKGDRPRPSIYSRVQATAVFFLQYLFWSAVTIVLVVYAVTDDMTMQAFRYAAF